MLIPKGSKRGRDNFDRMLRKLLVKKYGLPSTGKEVFVHLDVGTLSNYINQSLSTTEMENIKTHLVRCKRCRITVDSVLDDVRRFESGDLEKAPDSVSFNIAAYLKKLRDKDSSNSPKK